MQTKAVHEGNLFELAGTEVFLRLFDLHKTPHVVFLGLVIPCEKKEIRVTEELLIAVAVHQFFHAFLATDGPESLQGGQGGKGV
jgi:hypothetical protein